MKQRQEQTGRVQAVQRHQAQQLEAQQEMVLVQAHHPKQVFRAIGQSGLWQRQCWQQPELRHIVKQFDNLD